jgi:5'(3')-deoxyribonucleotidase
MDPYVHEVMTWCKRRGVTNANIAVDGKAIEFRKFTKMSVMLSNAQNSSH